MPATERTKVFISYSHADAEWLERLQMMLRPFTRAQTITVWDDTQIRAGSRWREEIQKRLAAAKVAVLLVSPHFLGSEFIANDELPRLLKAAEQEGLTILWVAVSASLYTETPIASYQAANEPARPLDSLSPAQVNEELVKIAQSIKEASSQPIPSRQEGSHEGRPSTTLQKRLIPKQPFEPEMILIPAGEFRMGSDPQHDKDGQGDEQPQHILFLPDYELARTPITNAQYAAFVYATNYQRPAHWTEERPPQGKEDHPVVEVSWYDAMAYCRWLSHVTAREYLLPSEAEWEKGARGTDGRIYPWGNQWDASRCNSEKGEQGDTTPVEDYPQGASRYGLLGMAGNVWEWTRNLGGQKLVQKLDPSKNHRGTATIVGAAGACTAAGAAAAIGTVVFPPLLVAAALMGTGAAAWALYRRSGDFKYPYNPKDGRENLAASGNIARVVRGGSTWDNHRFIRCTCRGANGPILMHRAVGFRVVMHP